MGRTTNFASSCVLLAAMLTGCSGTNTDSTNKVDELLIRADSYVQQHQYRAAIIETRNILQKDNGNIAARALIAQVNLEIGNPRGAIQALEGFAGKDSIDATLTLAQAYTLVGKITSADNVLKLIHGNELNAEQTARSFIYKASISAQQGHLDPALNFISSALKTQNLSPGLEQEARLFKVRLLMAQKKTSTAELELSQLLADHPRCTDALSLKARFAYQQENMEEAEDLLSQALLSLDKTDIITEQRIKILRSLSHILAKSGRPAEALVYSKIIAEARPGSEDMKAKIERAISTYKEGDTAETEKQLLTLYEENATDYIGMLLGALKLKQGEYEQAYTYLAEHVDPETASPKALRMLTEAQIRQNRPSEALAAMESNVRKDPNDARQQAIYGLTSLAQGNSEKGVEAINKALELDPTKTRLRAALAKHYNQTKQKQKALQQLEIAINQSPEDTTIQGMLINQLFINNEPTKALSVAKKFADSNPGIDTQLLYAAALQQHSQADQAEKIFKAILKDKPAEPRALKGMILTSMEQKKLAQAEGYADELIKVEPNDQLPYRVKFAVAQRNKTSSTLASKLDKQMIATPELWAPAELTAIVHMDNNDLDKAKANAEHLSSLADTSMDAKSAAMSTWMRISKTLIAQEQISEARTAIMEALALDPNNIKITKNLIGLELTNNNTREAEKLIDGLSIDKSSSLALSLRAALASQKQDHAEAAKLYRTLWNQSPSDDTGLKLYLSYQQLKDNQAIDTFISEWLTRFPDSIAVLRIQGERFLAQGKNLDAISTYQKLLEKTPNDVSTLNNLAWLLHVNKDNTTAIRHAQKAYQLAPESAAIADTYGWILSENGDHKEAVAILTKATELAPDNEEIRQHLQTAKAKAK